MNRKSVWLTLAIAGVLGCGCDSNRSGDLRAANFGDLSFALGERTAALVPLQASCESSPPGAGAGVLLRRPYLQQMTTQSVRVVWTTPGQTDPGTVVVTLPGGSFVATVTAERDLTARLPKGAFQWNAAISGLSPDTLYCYELQAGGFLVRRAGFRTPPAPASGRPVQFVALGDSGNGSADQQAVLEQILTVPLDFFVHLGDIAYENGSRAQLEAYFFRMYADLLENVAVFPVSGNHEYETEGAAPYREAFMLPENGGAAGFERWYSYDWGDVHFVALDTERTGPVQAAWLDADLAANRLPWTVVTLHKPPFSSGDHGNDAAVQKYFLPLFERHRVRLVLGGHDHHYERNHQMNGVIYVVSGAGGRGTRPFGRSTNTAFAESVCHFLFVTVAGDTMTVHAIDATGQEFDSFKLQR